MLDHGARATGPSPGDESGVPSWASDRAVVRHPSWADDPRSPGGPAPAPGVSAMAAAAPAALLDRPLLVTAFGPYPGQPVNPSELVVDELAGTEDVVSHVLDSSYRRAPAQLDGLVRMVAPSAVLCVGVSPATEVVRVERTARNLDDSPIADVDGEVRVGRRVDHGPDRVPTRLDVDRLVAALEAAGFPAGPSDDAGGHVGNHVLRHAVMSSDLIGVPVGLVHVPPLGEPDFDVSRYAVLARVLVASVVERLLERGQRR